MCLELLLLLLLVRYFGRGSLLGEKREGLIHLSFDLLYLIAKFLIFSHHIVTELLIHLLALCGCLGLIFNHNIVKVITWGRCRLFEMFVIHKRIFLTFVTDPPCAHSLSCDVLNHDHLIISAVVILVYFKRRHLLCPWSDCILCELLLAVASMRASDLIHSGQLNFFSRLITVVNRDLALVLLDQRNAVTITDLVRLELPIVLVPA